MSAETRAPLPDLVELRMLLADAIQRAERFGYNDARLPPVTRAELRAMLAGLDAADALREREEELRDAILLAKAEGLEEAALIVADQQRDADKYGGGRIVHDLTQRLRDRAYETRATLTPESPEARHE